MDQTSNVRDTAAFVRRVVRRTLTVIGGVAAGTALAWCLSTGAASAEADPSPLGGPTPVVAEVATPIGDTLDRLAQRLSDPPAENPLEEPITDVGDKLTSVADRFGDHAGNRVEVLPECDRLCPAAPVDDLGDTAELPLELDHPDTAPAAPVPAPHAVTDTGVDPERTAERTATGRVHLGVPSRGSPDFPSHPDSPTWPAPFAPVPPTAPAPGHSGHAGSHPADSVPSAALSWLDRTPGLVRGLTVPATEATTVGRVGAQPGVAPD